MPNSKYRKGVVDPITLIGISFLVITLCISAYITSGKSISLSILEKAAGTSNTGNTCFDNCRKTKGRVYCNNFCGININYKGEDKTEYVTTNQTTSGSLSTTTYTDSNCSGKCTSQQICVTIGYGYYGCQETTTLSYKNGDTRCTGNNLETFNNGKWNAIRCDHCKDNTCITDPTTTDNIIEPSETMYITSDITDTTTVSIDSSDESYHATLRDNPPDNGQATIKKLDNTVANSSALFVEQPQTSNCPQGSIEQKNRFGYTCVVSDEQLQNLESQLAEIKSTDTLYIPPVIENYIKSYAPDKVQYNYKDLNYNSLDECLAHNYAPGRGQVNQSKCYGYNPTKDQLTSSIELGTDIASVITLPVAPTVIGTKSALALVIGTFGSTMTVQQSKNAVIAQIEDPGFLKDNIEVNNVLEAINPHTYLTDAGYETAMAGLSWWNIASASRLINAWGGTNQALQQAARTENTFVSGVNLLVDIPNAVDTCSESGILSGNCAFAGGTVVTDIVFGGLDYKQGQLNLNPFKVVTETVDSATSSIARYINLDGLNYIDDGFRYNGGTPITVYQDLLDPVARLYSPRVNINDNGKTKVFGSPEEASRFYNTLTGQNPPPGTIHTNTLDQKPSAIEMQNILTQNHNNQSASDMLFAPAERPLISENAGGTNINNLANKLTDLWQQTIGDLNFRGLENDTPMVPVRNQGDEIIQNLPTDFQAGPNVIEVKNPSIEATTINIPRPIANVIENYIYSRTDGLLPFINNITTTPLLTNLRRLGEDIQIQFLNTVADIFPTVRQNIAEVLNDVLIRNLSDQVDKILTTAGEPKQVGCRGGTCFDVPDLVKYLGEQKGLIVNKYETGEINATRGVKSGLHYVAIVELDGSKFLMDQAFPQFEVAISDNPTSEVVRELLDKGFIRLTDETLTEYLNIIARTPNGLHISINVFDQVSPSPIQLNHAQIDSYLNETNATWRDIKTNGQPLSFFRTEPEIIQPNFITKITGAIGDFTTNVRNGMVDFIAEFANPLKPVENSITSKVTIENSVFNNNISKITNITNPLLTPVAIIAIGDVIWKNIPEDFKTEVWNSIVNFVNGVFSEKNNGILSSPLSPVNLDQREKNVENINQSDSSDTINSIPLINTPEISTTGVNLDLSTVPVQYTLTIFLTDTINDFYALQQTPNGRQQIINNINQSGLLDFYPNITLSVYDGSGVVTQDNKDTYALYIIAMAKLNGVTLNAETADFIKPGNSFAKWYGYDAKDNFQISQCVMWQNLLAITFPELNIFYGYPIENANDVNGFIKNKTTYSIINGGKLYQTTEAGNGLLIMSFTDINNVQRGDTCVYGSGVGHMCTILDKYEKDGKLYFLISEANSPNGKLDGTPQTYLVDEAGFMNLVGLGDSILFVRRTSTPTINADYLPSNINNATTPIQNSSQNNISTTHGSNQLIADAAVQKMQTCVPGNGGFYNACEGEFYNNQILGDTKNVIPTQNFDSNNSYSELYWCTQLVYDAAEASGIDINNPILAASDLYKDMVKRGAFINESSQNINQDLIGTVAFVAKPNNFGDAYEVAHVGIVSSVDISTNSTYVTITQANGATINATYKLDENGKLTYVTSDGVKYYIQGFGDLETYENNQ